jgi:hypothetical protein
MKREALAESEAKPNGRLICSALKSILLMMKKAVNRHSKLSRRTVIISDKRLFFPTDGSYPQINGKLWR